MSNLVAQSIMILSNPKPYVFGIAIGIPLLVTIVSASTDSLLREEIKEGKIATNFIYKNGKPSDALRSMLMFSKVLVAGILLSPFVSFSERILIILAMVGVSLFTSFME